MDDGILVSRLCSGDDTALGEIVDRHGAVLLGVARRVTGSQAMAEDVMQEVFARLWMHPHLYDPDRGSLRAYLGTMTYRAALDVVRSTGRRLARELRAEPLVAALPDPGEVASSAEVVRRAIEGLPAEQRRAVELTYWHGLTNREVAEVLGVPDGTVKSRLRLAQEKLRAALSPLELEPA